MVTGILMLIVAVLCLIAIFREGAKRNTLGAVYAFISCLVFGWFSIMTIWDILHGGGIPLGG